MKNPIPKPALLGLPLLLLGAGLDANSQGGGLLGEPESGPARAAQDGLSPELLEQGKSYFAIADYDGNGWISLREARQSLEVSRERYEVFDADRDGRVTEDEFLRVFELSIGRYGGFPPPRPKDGVATDEAEPNGAGEAPLFPHSEHPNPRSLDDLFGQALEREQLQDGTRVPARIRGPVPVFRRLDLDGDGEITIEDLNELRRPVQLGVRLRVIVAELDLDGDGGVSSKELARSMRHAD